MKTWKVTLELSVSDNWLEDGFDLTEEERKEQITEFFEEQLLPYSYTNEVIVNKLEVNEIN